MSHLVPIQKLDEEEQIAYGEVYVPYVLDSQNDFMTPSEIRKMAHRFLVKSQTGNIDEEHDFKQSGTVVIESYIAKANDPDGFIEGSWVLGVLCPDEQWDKVKKGEINGFSMAGRAERIKTKVVIDIPDDGLLKGETFKSDGDEGHTHKFVIEFNEKGQMVGGRTDTVEGHFHKITKGTATEKASGHRHRFSYSNLIEDLENAS